MPVIGSGNIKFFFSHVPRTAGRSFVQAMVQSGCDVDYRLRHGTHPHATWEETRKVFGSEIPCVAVVREPVERFLSAMRFEDRSIDAADMKKQIRGMRQPPQVEERHFRPQAEFVPEHALIFKYETELPDLEKYLRAFGFILPSVKIQRMNSGGSQHDLKGRVGLTKVRRWYKHDFRRFGYS